MNIVNAGSRFQVFGEDVRTFRNLPVGTYTINFHPMQGFYLTSHEDLTVIEDVIYGSSQKKVTKIMQSYKLMNGRNFGVLLSGQKGIGKSLFVRLVAQEGIKEGYPVIVVDSATPGIASFISSIAQDCVVIFDEFEKTFRDTDEWKPQDEMLSLFDGIDGGHKLFIVTCNELDNLSQYMINRPGRFHYHITMKPPTMEEVEQYMRDKVNPKYETAIQDVVQLSGAIEMPYDYLRAIAFELNQGYSLKETMQDLNITKANNLTFDIKAYRKDNAVYEAWNITLDLTSRRYEWLTVNNYDTATGRRDSVSIQICPSKAHLIGSEYIINEGIINHKYDADDFWEDDDEVAKKKAQEANEKWIFDRIVLTRVKTYGSDRYLV
jgi:hypothetical protein